jgi:hypothetical protein
MDKQAMVLVEELRKTMIAMSRGERAAIIVMLQSGYCKECFTDTLPCHCGNDE